MHHLFSGLARWVTDLIHAFGYLGVAVLTALEHLLPPIPSELILPLAGFLAGQGRFWLPAVILAATLGSVAGALVLYALGYWLGEHRLRQVIQRVGKYLLLKEQDLDHAAHWFNRHGGLAVLLGRFVPLVRSGISVPAGVERMPLWRFVIYTVCGSGGWNTALILSGWGLGEQWERVEPYARFLEYGALAVLAGGIGRFLW